MRRMRDLLSRYGLFVIPVGTLCFGAYYFLTPPKSTGKISMTSNEHSNEASKDSDRKVAGHEKAKHMGKKEVKEEEESDDDSPPSHHAGGWGAHDSKDAEESETEGDREIASASKGGVCQSVEVRGDGPEATRVSPGDWTRVMDAFHKAKHQLTDWLEKNSASIPAETLSKLEKQMLNTKVHRPPATTDVDLTWRGIATWQQQGEDAPIIYMGSGFVKLIQTDFKRGQFEFARLLTQGWSPCELERMKLTQQLWDPLLKCLGMDASQGCVAGGNSETAWAISTTLAQTASPSACMVPAFNENADMTACLQVPFEKAHALLPVQKPTWKGASR